MIIVFDGRFAHARRFFDNAMAELGYDINFWMTYETAQPDDFRYPKKNLLSQTPIGRQFSSTTQETGGRSPNKPGPISPSVVRRPRLT